MVGELHLIELGQAEVISFGLLVGLNLSEQLGVDRLASDLRLPVLGLQFLELPHLPCVFLRLIDFKLLTVEVDGVERELLEEARQ